MTIIVQSDHITAGAWAAKWTLSKRRTDYRILDRPCRKHELAESTHSNARGSFVRSRFLLVEIKRVTDSMATQIKHTWVAPCDFTCDWLELA